MTKVVAKFLAGLFVAALFIVDTNCIMLAENTPILNYHSQGESKLESVNSAEVGKLNSVSSATIPKSYIPDIDKLPDVRNQNPFGTCWTFTSMALAEISILKNENKLLDLSELQLAYFSYNKVLDPIGGTVGDDVYLPYGSKSYLQLGGNLEYAMYTLAGWQGAVAEAEVPYRTDSDAEYITLDSEYSYGHNVAHLRNGYAVLRSDTAEVKKLIMKYGAVGTCYYHRNDCYSAENNCFYNALNNESNHAVACVGWDDNYSASRFKTAPPGNGAWLVRNSWGKNGFNKYGYFWISYYDKSLGDNIYAFDFVSADSDEYYDNNYQYDGAVTSGYSMVVAAANVFEAKKESEILKAVSFATNSTNKGVNVKIYKNIPAGNNPTKGELVSEINAQTVYAGVNTIELCTPVELKRGERFAVVLSFDEKTSVLSEYSANDTGYWLNSQAYSKEGQSYVCYTSTWHDFGKSGIGNLRIKAYTDTELEDPVAKSVENPITDIRFEVMNEEYNIGASFLPEYIAMPSNSMENIEWRSSDRRVATVSSTGNVIVVGYGEATITAKTSNVTACFKVKGVLPDSINPCVEINKDRSATISWDKVSNASPIVIKRVLYDGTEQNVCTLEAKDGNTAIDQNTRGVEYYKIKIGPEKTYYTAEILPMATNVTALKRTGDGVEISWGPARCAYSYMIYRKEVGGSWSLLKNLKYSETGFDGKANYYIDKAVVSGKSYCYSVKSVSSTGLSTEMDMDGMAIDVLKSIPNPPKGLKLNNTKKLIKLSWENVAEATAYRIYKRTGTGEYKYVAELAAGSNEWIDSAVENGVRYGYRISTVIKESESILSKDVSTCYLTPVKIKKASRKGNKSVAKLQWTRNKKASGYIIAYSKKSSFKGAKQRKISGSKKLGTTLRSLSKKKKYYIRIRAYRTIDKNTYYSTWSGRKKL